MVQCLRDPSSDRVSVKGSTIVRYRIEYSSETERHCTDAESIALSQSPQFLAIMERSRTRYAQEGGVSSADMRKRFGLAPTQDDSPAAAELL
jgi:hypothetical protein